MGVQPSVSANLLVLHRPHFHLKGDVLFFMVSQRPSRVLTDVEMEIWGAIQRPVAMDELRKRFPGRADDVIQEFWRSELCELVEPVFREARRRVVVIEPHADDAALSVGGVMWLRRHECMFIVATMASRSNFTSYYNLGRDYFNVRQVMEVRRKESELFTRMIGGIHWEAGLTDVVLRYRDTDWSLDFFQRRRISIAVATSRSASGPERERWTKAVHHLLAEIPSDEVWIPLGGPHTDHVLTMNACLAAFASYPQLIGDRVIRVYQDVPYAARFPNFTDEMVLALRQAGVEMEAEVIPIGDAFDQKLRLVSLYASQFKMQAMREDIETNARTHESVQGHAELLWTVHAMPNWIDPLGIVPESATERKQEAAAAAWISKNQEADRIRILLLVPTGRWADDLELLCEVFPRARFEVFVAPDAVTEVADADSNRVEVREVEAGSMAWGLLSLWLAGARSMPTLFHAGERRLREAKCLSKLWVGSDTLVVASMNRVVRVFADRKQPAGVGT